MPQTALSEPPSGNGTAANTLRATGSVQSSGHYSGTASTAPFTFSGEATLGSGRHGVHGVALEGMRRVKHALDPQGLMNPAKVLPDDRQDL
jgi:FAD/FMN-containing dehydrogenase